MQMIGKIPLRRISEAPARPDLLWFSVAAVTLVATLLAEDIDWLRSFPEEWTLPFIDWLNVFMAWVVEWSGSVFRAFADLLAVPFGALNAGLVLLPWPVTFLVVVSISYSAGGWKLAAFSTASLGYILVLGYWQESMTTLALVGISVPLAILLGFLLAVAGNASSRAESIILPILDLLQTVPAFAYLIPILLLFGFGPVVGIIAGVLFAAPPMARNTLHGLQAVDANIVESGLMSGATRSQIFWRVRVPTASPQIMLGINQCTMAALSMVIVASVIGGTRDIGWEVLSTMRKAQFGESILAGFVIALIAMNMDRITHGFATRRTPTDRGRARFPGRYGYWLCIGALIALVFALERQAPVIRDFPRSWTLDPAPYLNAFVEHVVFTYGTAIENIKSFFFFYVMLPVKIGLVEAVSPFTWGFELTNELVGLYAALAAALAILASWRRSISAGGLVALAGIVLYFGLTNLPWLSILLIVMVLAWRRRGPQFALFAFGIMAFLMLAGVWERTVLSIYLSGVAVAIAFVAGAAIGVLAAGSDRISAVVRPVNDTLQTMPLFVLLIPLVMIFKIGEFTALLAIIAYAIVPAMRYTELALRTVPLEVVEAAKAMGCSRLQLLMRVRLPLARSGMMLGLNQTIMYAIAMLVIAALVGTSELGQLVYIGLGDGDFGVGMVAGLGMAAIGILADRLTRPQV